MISFKYRDNCIVPLGGHSKCCTREVTEIVESRMKKESQREREKPWLLSHLHTAGQAVREVDVND